MLSRATVLGTIATAVVHVLSLTVMLADRADLHAQGRT